MPLKTLVVGILMLGGSAVAAQTSSPQSSEFRQFDFWLGDWDVFDAQGNPGGKSRIESIADGHGILENWTDSNGTTGKSLNTYNPEKRCWQQFWVGDGTPVLELSGGIVDGNMVLTGTRQGKGDIKVTDRIAWTPNADGSVRQRWQSSVDGGKTWKDDFDGIYRRRPAH